MNHSPDHYEQRVQALSFMWRNAQAMDDAESVSYEIQFDFQPDQENIVLDTLNRMPFDYSEITKDNSGSNLSVNILAQGTDGLKQIINFDRAVAKQYLIKVATQMRLDDMDYEMKYPYRAAFKRWFQRYIWKPKMVFQVPTETELDQEIHRIYANAGILFQDDE